MVQPGTVSRDQESPGSLLQSSHWLFMPNVQANFNKFLPSNPISDFSTQINFKEFWMCSLRLKTWIQLHYTKCWLFSTLQNTMELEVGLLSGSEIRRLSIMNSVQVCLNYSFLKPLDKCFRIKTIISVCGYWECQRLTVTCTKLMKAMRPFTAVLTLVFPCDCTAK